MPGLLIKDIPADLHENLKQRAAYNHRSLTKEALAILEAALREDGGRPTLARVDRRRIRGAKPLTDALIRKARTAGRM